MAIPTARVKVEIIGLTDLPSITPEANATRYLRCRFETVSGPEHKWRIYQTGRSKPIPAAGGSFDPTKEKTPWVFEADLNPTELIWFQVAAWVDRGDLEPPAPLLLTWEVTDPWTSGEQTVKQKGVTIKLKVTTRLINPTDNLFLARAANAAKASGSLTVPQGYFVEITDIAGLYKQNPIATGTPGSKAVPGYKSDDNKGRIFTNRLPDGTWASGKQFIDVKVKVSAFGTATLPAAAKLQWTIEDPDDPTNDEPHFHRDWGPYIDPNDYDVHGLPTGAVPGDNTGAFKRGNTDKTKLFGPDVGGTLTNRWAKAPGGPSPAAASDTKATTHITIVSPQVGTSSVRIHCTNVGGTNLLLKVGLAGTPAGIPIFEAFTGTMTMWSRIDVEVARMPGAHTLAGALPKIPQFFLPACVQMDIQSEKIVAAEFDIEQLAGDNEDLEEDKTREWINNVFVNKAKPGWFFLGGARFASIKAAGDDTPPLFDDTNYTLGVDGDSPFVEVPGHTSDDGRQLTIANFVSFHWNDWDEGGGELSASFGVDKTTSVGGKTRIVLEENDFAPEFTGDDADGSVKHAYKSEVDLFPQHQMKKSEGTLKPGGFGIPAAGARVTLFAPGETFTTGISPGIKKDDNMFAGRTVVFTSTIDAAGFDDEVLQTAVHEFVHAFGMPHKCGFWDWQTKRATSCCMNYFNTWLVDMAPPHALQPGHTRKMGNHMCGRHLMEVRRVHIDKNKALKW